MFHSWGVFADFLDNSGVVAFIKDYEGRFIWQNEAYLRVFRLKKEDQLGKNDFECWDAETAKGLREHDLDIFQKNEPVMLVEKVPVDGEQNWLVFKFPFENEEYGRMIGGFAIRIPKSLGLEIK